MCALIDVVGYAVCLYLTATNLFCSLVYIYPLIFLHHVFVLFGCLVHLTAQRARDGDAGTTGGIMDTVYADDDDPMSSLQQKLVRVSVCLFASLCAFVRLCVCAFVSVLVCECVSLSVGEMVIGSDLFTYFYVSRRVGIHAS